MTTISEVDAMIDALEICGDLGFEMTPGFATHWAMGSETLITLGRADMVHEWATTYRETRQHFPRHETIETIDPDDEASWRAALGHFDRAGDWYALFNRELAERPWADVLVTWWPRLMPGVAAGLTHGLIRTTHIVRHIGRRSSPPNDRELSELAMGLAYWTAHHVQQPARGLSGGSAWFPDVIASVPRLAPGSGLSLRNKGLFLHMGDVDGWGDAVDALREPHDIQRALSDLTLAFAQAMMAHSDQFPVPLIHTVTAPAAVRLMLPHLPVELHLPTFVSMWQCNAALLTTFALDRRSDEISLEAPGEPEETLPRDELVGRAVEHGDEHAIKLTEACLREFDLRPDPRYLIAAARGQAKLPDMYRRARRRAAQVSS